MLNEKQVQKVISLLKKKNKVKDNMILEEMTDHFCCSIEKKMILGQSFENSFEEVAKDLNEKETNQIESNVRKINFRLRLKRKVKSVTAVAATLILLMVLGADAQIKPDIAPIKGKFDITSKYGIKRNVVTKNGNVHRGIDIKAKMGTPIYATASGRVREASHSDEGYGNKIILSHDESYETLYAHLSKIIIKAGDVVNKGELIGYSGNSGWSKGPHLHYEVLENGKRVNPEQFIESADE